MANTLQLRLGDQREERAVSGRYGGGERRIGRGGKEGTGQPEDVEGEQREGTGRRRESKRNFRKRKWTDMERKG